MTGQEPQLQPDFPVKKKEHFPLNIIHAEKNLASVGFFTASSKKLDGIKEKIVPFSQIVDGEKIKARVTILPSAKFGLPITADQDTFMGILKIAMHTRKEKGILVNPIGFSFSEILKIQSKSHVSGYHYKELREHLLRIKSSTILGGLFLTSQNRWVEDAYSVFDRVVLFGQQMEDGSIANRNFVYFADWLLKNINDGHLRTLDYEAYKGLKNHIAKALLPYLESWLYASRGRGECQRNYDEICQLVGIRQYIHRSRVKEQLGPSLEEFKTGEYLSHWNVEKKSDGKGYKMVFYHGEKYKDKRHFENNATEPKREEIKQNNNGTETQNENESTVLAGLGKFGISQPRIHTLVAGRDLSAVKAKIEQFNCDLAAGNLNGIRNPAGLLISLIRENAPVPASFETSDQRKIREEKENIEKEKEARRKMADEAYREYRRKIQLQWVRENVPDKERIEKKEWFREHWPRWSDELLDHHTEISLCEDNKDRINVMSFEEFSRQQNNLFPATSSLHTASAEGRNILSYRENEAGN